MAYYKDADANRKKKEKEALLWFGAKAQMPVTMLLTKDSSHQNEGLRMGSTTRHVVQGLKDAVVQSAEMQSTNQNLLAAYTGETVKKAAQNTVRSMGQAASANSKAQMTAAELNRSAIRNAGRTAVKGAAELSGAQADAQRATAENIVQAVKSASNKYGEIWGMTSGVIGSDQTGASIWGYRKGTNHIGQHDESEKEIADRIRSQIEDGGVDALLHGLGARVLSGFKTLDGYNKHLQFAATGKIQDDMTVTPGAYSEIVDEAIAEYFEERYGGAAKNAYNGLVSVIDDVFSSVALGTPIEMIKSSFDTANDTLEQSLEMGRSESEAINHAFTKGASDALGSLIVGDLNEIRKTVDFPVPIKLEEVIEKIPDSTKRSMEAGLVDGGAAVIEDIISGLLEKGFNREQSNKIVGYELDKAKKYGREITVGVLQSIAGRLLK